MMMPDGRVYGEKAIRELQVGNLVETLRIGNVIATYGVSLMFYPVVDLGFVPL